MDIHLQTIQNYIKEKNLQGLKNIYGDIPPADLTHIFRELHKEDQLFFFRSLPRDTAAQVFSHLEHDEENALIATLTDNEARQLLHDLDPDDRTEFFEELPGRVTQKILNLLDDENVAEIRMLLGYAEDTVGRFMTPDYIAVRPSWTTQQALDHIRQWGNKSETSDVIYVTNTSWELLGAISLRNLVIANQNETIESIMKSPAISIHAHADQESAVHMMQKYDISVLPVIDDKNILVGIITVDDVLDIAEEEATEDFHRSSAIDAFQESFLKTSIFFLYKKRIGWLVLLTFVNILSGAIIMNYEATLQQAIALVAFLPLLIGSAGNSGSQSATLTIRAMATGDVHMGDWLRVIWRELRISLLLGITMGAVVWGLGIFRSGETVALIVALTMVMIVLLGSLLGVCLPFLLSKLKLDPATASSPLVTSIADILGVLIYLLIAKALLGIG
jgi:magnesium transporter